MLFLVRCHHHYPLLVCCWHCHFVFFFHNNSWFLSLIHSFIHSSSLLFSAPLSFFISPFFTTVLSFLSAPTFLFLFFLFLFFLSLHFNCLSLSSVTNSIHLSFPSSSSSLSHSSSFTPPPFSLNFSHSFHLFASSLNIHPIPHFSLH